MFSDKFPAEDLLPPPPSPLIHLLSVNFAKLLTKPFLKTLLVVASVLVLPQSLWKIILEVLIVENRELRFHKTLLIEH